MYILFEGIAGQRLHWSHYTTNVASLISLHRSSYAVYAVYSIVMSSFLSSSTKDENCEMRLEATADWNGRLKRAHEDERQDQRGKMHETRDKKQDQR
jgi:hypothetical protein